MSNQASAEQLFDSKDVDGSGSLTFDELKGVLCGSGYTEAQAQKLFDETDNSGDGKLSKDEFVAALTRQPPNIRKGAAVRRMCQEFDINGDKTITRDELQKVMKETFPHNEYGEEEMNKLMAEVDTDGSGCISYDELIDRLFPQSD